ncbi:retron Se72 family effector protein [Halomonas elongata]|uniref:retron Se72 family effector protein n=1 Tax=Halomonas elongata TaxID=2746 RepID=UPI0023B15921|nr:retron Se72 family effector protein [Halomonas elongata]
MKHEVTERETGTINHYSNLKGFGFIRRKKGKDVFFFYEDFVDGDADVVIGDTVSFEVKKMPKGPRAYKIEPFHKES